MTLLNPFKSPGATSAFGEIKVTEPTPIVQIDATHGLRSLTDTETFTAGSGTAVVSDTGTGLEYVCTSTSTVGSYGVIRSRAYLHYRSGQGASAKFTARFPTGGVADGRQAAGLFATGTELSFGYNGVNFGVLHRTGGYLEVQTLSISAAATGNETVTITLAGSGTNVSVTSGTAAHNAAEIAAGSFTGWNAYNNGSTVVFVATTVGDKTSTFSLSSDGTCAGTFAETQAGTDVTDTFINQSSWNIDVCDGSGPSGMVLDPSKGNVYEVQYQYYGQILFSVESPGYGRLIPVHRIQYVNANTSPSLLQPQLKIGWFAASLGTTTPMTVAGASAAGFIEGKITEFRNPWGANNSATSIGTTLTNVLAVRTRAIFAGVVNSERVNVLQINVSVEATKPVICEVILNPTYTTAQQWIYVNENNSIAEYSTTSSTVAAGASSQKIANLAISKSGQVTIDAKALGISVDRTDSIAIGVKATSGTADVAVGCTWVED